MNPHLVRVLSRIVHSLPLLGAVSAALLCTGSAQADLILSVQSVTANAGSTGNTLELDLQNTGASAVSVEGYSFGIMTNTSNIDFTGATTATTQSYIFSADSFANATLGGNTTGAFTGQTLTAADFSLSNMDSVAAGATVGLGEVFFDVAPGTGAGQIPVTLVTNPPDTVLSDPAGLPVNFDIQFIPGTTTPATITVNSSGPPAVPEPSTLLMALLSCPAGIWMAWRQRIAAARAARNGASDWSAPA
jgi:hypothetical protein